MLSIYERNRIEQRVRTQNSDAAEIASSVGAVSRSFADSVHWQVSYAPPNLLRDGRYFLDSGYNRCDLYDLYFTH